MYTSTRDTDGSSGPSTCSLTLPPNSLSCSFSMSRLSADREHYNSTILADSDNDNHHYNNNNSDVTSANASTIVVDFDHAKKSTMFSLDNYKYNSTDSLPSYNHENKYDLTVKNNEHYSRKREICKKAINNDDDNNSNNDVIVTSKNRVASKSRSLSRHSTVLTDVNICPSEFTSMVLSDTFDVNRFITNHDTHHDTHKQGKNKSSLSSHKTHNRVKNDVETCKLHVSNSKSCNSSSTRKEEELEYEEEELEREVKENDQSNMMHHNKFESKEAADLFHQSLMGRSLPTITNPHTSAKLFRPHSPLPRKPNETIENVLQKSLATSNKSFPTTNVTIYNNINSSSHKNHISEDNLLDQKYKYNNNDNHHTSNKQIYKHNSQTINDINNNINKEHHNTNEHGKSNFKKTEKTTKKKHSTHHQRYHREEHHEHHSESSAVIKEQMHKSQLNVSSSPSSSAPPSENATTAIKGVKINSNYSNPRQYRTARSITFDDDNITPNLVIHHFEKDLWEWMEQFYTPVATVELKAARGTVKVEQNKLFALKLNNTEVISTRKQQCYSRNCEKDQEYEKELEEEEEEELSSSEEYEREEEQRSANKEDAKKAMVLVKTVPLSLRQWYKSNKNKDNYQWYTKKRHNSQEQEREQHELSEEHEQLLSEELREPELSLQLRQVSKLLKKEAVNNILANRDVLTLQSLIISDNSMNKSTFANHVEYELQTVNNKITRTVFLYTRPYLTNANNISQLISKFWILDPFTEATDALPFNSEPTLNTHDRSHHFMHLVATLLWQIVCALCSLHELEIIHGNLKPSNILVDMHHGECKVELTDYLLPLFPEGYVEHLPLRLCKSMIQGKMQSMLSARERVHKTRMITKESHSYVRLIQTLHTERTNLCFSYGSATPTRRTSIVQHRSNKAEKASNNAENEKISVWQKEMEVTPCEEEEEESQEKLNMLLHFIAPECVLVTCQARKSSSSEHSMKGQVCDKTIITGTQNDDSNINVEESDSIKSFDACADVGEMLAREINSNRNNRKDNEETNSTKPQKEKSNYKSNNNNNNNKSTNRSQNGCNDDNTNNNNNNDNGKEKVKENEENEKEQIWINENKKSAASDAYAVGVLLYVMVIGHYPLLPPFQRAIRTHRKDHTSFASNYSECHSYNSGKVQYNDLSNTSTRSTHVTEEKGRRKDAPVYDLQEPVMLDGIAFRGYLWSVRNEQYMERKYGKGGMRRAMSTSLQQSSWLSSVLHWADPLLINIIESLLEPDVSNRMTLQELKESSFFRKFGKQRHELRAKFRMEKVSYI